MQSSRPLLAAINAVTKHKHAQHFFKRAQTGIFHGRAIRFGNNVPESGQRTPRTWLPNIQSKRLKSDILDRTMRMNVTTRALRTIKKYGSLDNYLLKVRTKWLGERAMWLRAKLQDRSKTVEENNSAGRSIAHPVAPFSRPKTELELASDRLLVVKGYKPTKKKATPGEA